jgi:outer membrane protein insertion porin family
MMRLWLSLVMALLVASVHAQDRPTVGEALDDLFAGEGRENYVTRVRLDGMTTISESDALGLIGSRLEHVRRQAPSPSRASDAAFMARQLFRSHGFNQCEVSWRITGPNVIQLIVTEGPRQDLGEVKVEGVDGETAQRMVKLFSNPSEKRRFAGGQRPPFRESDIDEGLALIIADFHSRGYWTATAEVKARVPRPGRSEIDFVIATRPGPLHVIGQATVEGAGANGREVARIASTFVGRPADTAAINGVRAAVQTYYRQRGFTKAKILMTSAFHDGRFIPGFIIEEGKSYQLGKIRFNGLEKTKPWRIRQRIADMEGRTLDDTVMEKRLRGMMATGAFEAVRLETTEREGDVVDATLQLVEGEARGYTLSLGLGSYEGPIAGVAYYDRNFLGRLYNFNSGVEVTARSILGEVTLTDPWLWGTDASGVARLFLLTRSNEGYSTWKSGLEFGVNYPVNDHYLLDARVSWSFVNSNSDGIPGNLMGETVYQNPYVRVSQRLEYRDSPVLPTKGWYLEMPVELGAAVGEFSTSYAKAELMGSWQRPVGGKGSVALGGRGGVLVPSGNDLPIDLRYFLGGARSVRSYTERELGPHSRTGYPIGGQAYWVTNAEYTHKVAGAMKLVGFVDAGALSSSWDNLGSSDLDVAAGLGIRFDLPVGPVRLEYGHNLTQDPGEPSGAWHFAIGIAF